jgi:hypothetical protein
MNNAPITWLLISGAAEILVASGLGYAMLIPMQPWAQRLRERWPPPRVLMSIHLDLVMLSLMQFAAAAGVHALPGAHDRLAAGLLAVAGWLNVTPYIWRAVGVNAFALAGGALQRTAALISLAGTLALTAGWIVLLASWATR